MEKHYNAFISYRHHPDDIRAAEEIHRALERCRIPRSLKKATGGITRLFRDKDELPITSNLSDEITAALRNSDYLIVICSPHLRESAWCQREIDYFISTHDRSHVLTALVEGEPYDVIPECLLKETRVDPETGKTEEVTLEPLSCDWRNPSRKIRAQELARLAAPLLGVSYDELRQRQKHYRTQRRMAAMGVALCISMGFLGYVLHSNHQLGEANVRITENLNQALKNQSEYLASESGRLFEEGNRLTGMLLAMEALPDYPGQRPYSAAAEAALAQAAGVYQASARLAADASMHVGALVSDLVLTGDGKILYVTDQQGGLSAWNAETSRLISRTVLTEWVYSMHATPGSNILIEDSQGISCYSPEGTLIWQETGYKDFTNFFQAGKVAILREGEDGLARLSFLDPDTGKPLADPLTVRPEFESGEIPTFLKDQSPGEVPVLQYSTMEEDILAMPDLQTGSARAVFRHDQWVNNYLPGPEDSLLLLTSDGSGAMNGRYAGMVTTSPGRQFLQRVDCKTGSVLWSVEVSTFSSSSLHVLEQIPGTGNCLCQAGNRFFVIDWTTGEVRSQSEVLGMPIAVRVKENQASVILDNGFRCILNYETGRCDAKVLAKGGIRCAQIGDAIYTAEETSFDLVAYRRLSDGNAMEYDTPAIRPQKSVCADGLIAVHGYDKDLMLLDQSQRKARWSLELEDRGELLGISGGKVWMTPDRGMLSAFDLADGTRTDVAFPEEIDGTEVSYCSQFLLQGSRIYTFADNNWGSFTGDRVYFVCYDTETQETIRFDAARPPVQPEGSAHVQLLAAYGDHMLLWEDVEGKIYEVDFARKTLEAGTEVSELMPHASAGENGAALCLADRVLLKPWGEAPVQTVSIPGVMGVSVHAWEDQLLILGNDAKVYRSDAEGRILGSFTISVYSSFFGFLDDSSFRPWDIVWQHTPDGGLVLQTFSSASTVNCKEWGATAFVPHCSVYLPEADEFVVYQNNSDQNVFAGFRRYTPETLTEYASQELGDLTLTPEQRKQYGIAG